MFDGNTDYIKLKKQGMTYRNLHDGNTEQYKLNKAIETLNK